MTPIKDNYGSLITKLTKFLPKQSCKLAKEMNLFGSITPPYFYYQLCLDAGTLIWISDFHFIVHGRLLTYSKCFHTELKFWNLFYVVISSVFIYSNMLEIFTQSLQEYLISATLLNKEVFWELSLMGGLLHCVCSISELKCLRFVRL